MNVKHEESLAELQNKLKETISALETKLDKISVNEKIRDLTISDNQRDITAKLAKLQESLEQMQEKLDCEAGCDDSLETTPHSLA